MSYDNLPKKSNHWLSLIVLLLILLALSWGFAYLLQKVGSQFVTSIHNYDQYVYFIIFGITLASNLTVIAPVPIASAVMIGAATIWNPILVALVASIGGTLGELSGYYAGYLGKKIAFSEHVIGYEQISLWMNRYGPWAIFFLAFQPVLPFDIGGLVAGAARMPLAKFLFALWAGRFPKYLILCYTGLGLKNLLPSLFGN